MSFLWVASGGALGAMGRYAISLMPVKSVFPVLTLITNLIGAVAIGFIAGMASAKESVSPNLILFTKTGVCGGFTTFSTFSLEAYDLFSAKQYLFGSIYVCLSVIFCMIGIGCGKKISTAFI
ncbi:MAG: fluoride efflux transporter CrcB [Blautia sp.]|nr:fluoride efflux transporter CrcB [Blautia sp.]MCM1200832.1 fluoride efflux transporter CrcB [Bacteroides fragilis]